MTTPSTIPGRARRRRRHLGITLALVGTVVGGCFSEDGAVSGRARDAALDEHAGSIGRDASRNRVLVSGTVSYAAVLAAVKAGRVVAVAGESDSELDMRIGNLRLGDTTDVAARKPVDVDIKTDQRAAGMLRLIANGQVVHEEMLPAGPQTRRVPVAFRASTWIRATIPRVATNPIYVTVDGAPIRPSADAPCYFMQYIDHLSNLVATGPVDMGVDKPAALAAYAEARGIFATRFAEATGQTCP